jgi:hypothetical protein
MLSSLLLLLTLGAAAQSEDPRPAAVLGETIVDFGEMARGDVATRTITLENRGTAPLEIRRVRNTCACTVLDSPTRVEPGAKAELTLKLDTETLTGPASAIVNLYTNDPAAPRLDISVRVMSRPYVWAEPQEFRYQVHRYFDGSGVAQAKVAGSSPSDFRILSIESPYPFLTVTHREALPEERLTGTAPGTQYVLEAKLDPEAPVGPLKGWVRVTTDHAKQKKLSLSVSGFVRPVLHVTPPEAEFGKVTLGAEPLVWTHHVRNFAEETIQITSIETDIAGLSATIKPGRHDHELYLELTLRPDVPKGEIRGKLTLVTDSAKVPRLDIPVELTIE